MRFLVSFLLSLGLLPLLALETASALTLDSFKDDLFSNDKRQVLEKSDDGAFTNYYWDEMEDVNGRDAIPGETAKPERVDLSVNKQQRDVTIDYPGGTMEAYEVGEPKDANFAVIFIHGADGNKSLGAQDLSFGGNFNRIKNIAARNKGVYYSPSVTFDEKGVTGIEHLFEEIKKKSPNAKILISCASAGGYICCEAARRKEMSDKLAGLIFLGASQFPYDYINTPAYKAKIPVLVSHGSADRLVSVSEPKRFFEDVHGKDPKYPIQYELYNGGKHGTPMRMTDWKKDIEWLVSPNSPNSSKTAAGKPASSGSKPKHKSFFGHWFHKHDDDGSSKDAGAAPEGVH